MVAVDGIPCDTVAQISDALNHDGTVLLLNPARRYAFAVTMPLHGDLVLEMAPLRPDEIAQFSIPSFNTPGILYVNKGKKYAAGYLGQEVIDPSLISYYDFQFLYPVQELLRATPAGNPVPSVPFEYGTPLNTFTSYQALYKAKAFNRNFLIVSQCNYKSIYLYSL